MWAPLLPRCGSWFTRGETREMTMRGAGLRAHRHWPQHPSWVPRSLPTVCRQEGQGPSRSGGGWPWGQARRSPRMQLHGEGVAKDATWAQPLWLRWASVSGRQQTSPARTLRCRDPDGQEPVPGEPLRPGPARSSSNFTFTVTPSTDGEKLRFQCESEQWSSSAEEDARALA